MNSIVPFLWFEKEAEEAARFYVSLLPNSHLDHVTALPAESPSGPPGSVKVVEFTLAGQTYQAMEAKGADSFNHAVSLLVPCETQEEIDRLWDAHLKNGGRTEACGWLKDRWGVSWQITPRVIFDMYRSPDRAAAKRAAEAMMTMIKLDIAALEKAFAGKN